MMTTCQYVLPVGGLAVMVGPSFYGARRERHGRSAKDINPKDINFSENQTQQPNNPTSPYIYTNSRKDIALYILLIISYFIVIISPVGRCWVLLGSVGFVLGLCWVLGRFVGFQMLNAPFLEVLKYVNVGLKNPKPNKNPTLISPKPNKTQQTQQSQHEAGSAEKSEKHEALTIFTFFSVGLLGLSCKKHPDIQLSPYLHEISHNYIMT